MSCLAIFRKRAENHMCMRGVWVYLDLWYQVRMMWALTYPMCYISINVFIHCAFNTRPKPKIGSDTLRPNTGCRCPNTTLIMEALPYDIFVITCTYLYSQNSLYAFVVWFWFMAFSVFTGAFTSRLPCAMVLYYVWDFNGSWHKWSFRSWFTFYSQSCWPSLATSAFANVFGILLLVLLWQHYDDQWVATSSRAELNNLVSSILHVCLQSQEVQQPSPMPKVNNNEWQDV